MRTYTVLEPTRNGVSSKKFVTRRTFCAAAVPATPIIGEPRDGVASRFQVGDGTTVVLRRGRGNEGQQATPGSVLKPLVLTALIESGKLARDETYLCSGRLTVAGRQLNCVHPHMAMPMDVARAIAYSCNGAVANWASRMTARELADALRGFGLRVSDRVADVRLLALGEEGVRVSAGELLTAYRRCRLPGIVRRGMDGAVEFGTAQRAALPDVRVAGKTGSGGTTATGRVAWFAGFAPSEKPKVFVVVMAAGSSGGADAAPWAREVLLEGLESLR